MTIAINLNYNRDTNQKNSSVNSGNNVTLLAIVFLSISNKKIFST